jgi:uncharacterized caspase-like protein
MDQRILRIGGALLAGLVALTLILSGQPIEAQVAVDELMTVDCLLPGQLKKLGRRNTFLTAKRPLQTTARDCDYRGGEYVAYDRANYKTALAVWLDSARQGSAEAQTIVGEIYELGLGIAPDYELAALWYERAVRQGDTRAATNLAFLYEQGLGVPQDRKRALALYKAAFGYENQTVGLTDTPQVAQEGGVQRMVAEVQRSEAQILSLLTDLEVKRAAGETEQIGEIERQIASVRKEVETLESKIKAEKTSLGEAASRSLSADAAAGVQAGPPEIAIIEPKQLQARGAGDILLRSRSSESRVVVGQIDAPAGLKKLSINGTDQTTRVTGGGLFSVAVPITGETTDVAIVVTDRIGQSRNLDFRFVMEGAEERMAKGPSLKLPGSYYALVIGNDDYEVWPDLMTAVRDAEAVAEILQKHYGFEETRVLRNANRLDILMALEDYREKLGEKDKLLIYYAGHGYLEQNEDLLEPEMYWIPVDGDKERVSNWIPTAEISRHLNRVQASSVLIVADSCYSGWLVGASATEPSAADPVSRSRYVEELGKQVARLVLSSGTLQPVLDEGGNGHSVFARHFLDVLRLNDRILSSRELYRLVRANVMEATQELTGGAALMIQEPDYGGIRRSRHEGGEFFLVPTS